MKNMQGKLKNMKIELIEKNNSEWKDLYYEII